MNKQKKSKDGSWIARVGAQIWYSVKIALGTCCAIILAEKIHLDFANSAGIITLLTILSTKWETVRLAGSRLLSFGMTVALSWLIFGHLEGDWFTYGVFILGLTTVSCMLGWKNTISVNAVIGTHFLSSHEFGPDAILNELYLLLIGLSVSIVFNLFHNNSNQKTMIIRDMRYIEEQLKKILLHIADLLMQKEGQQDILQEIMQLETHLEESLERTYEYQGNTFVSHPEYYIRYIEMRMNQCGSLQNLHDGIKKIRKMPSQAKPIADYIIYVSSYVNERNIPAKQLDSLEELKNRYRRESLPKTREEFESRAVLYHIIMDLEEFLIFKSRFVDCLDEKQKKIYWDMC